MKSCGADIRIGIQIKRTELRVQKEMQISITNISEAFRWRKKSPTEKKNEVGTPTLIHIQKQTQTGPKT